MVQPNWIYSKLKECVLPLKRCSHLRGPAFTPEPQMCKKHRTVNICVCVCAKEDRTIKKIKLQASMCMFILEI